jgi:integrase
MAIAKRGKTYHLRVRLFGGNVIGVKTPAKTKAEAKRIEMALMTACRSGDYRALEPVSREVCVRLFKNQGWELPLDLVGREPVQELTLWAAAEIFFKYPEIKDSPTRWRYECCMVNLVEKLGPDRPIKSIWVPDLKKYQIERLNEGASEGSINWEMSTLSKLFGVMIDLRLVDTNPVRLVKKLSVKSGERQVYISHDDFLRIVDRCPAWFQRVAKTAYYTGMRRGEILGLRRKQVKLARRMILLGPEDTKEAHWKRVPVHPTLVPVLEEAMRITSLERDRVFLVQDRRGVRPIDRETAKNPWPRACRKLGLEKPWPRLHDLRHTWKTNARRSGMDPEIRESILGHWFREKSVSERYGRISDEELQRAIDQMTFDHGQTEILVASH